MAFEPVSRAYLVALRSDSAALRLGARDLRSEAIAIRAASREIRADIAHRYARQIAAGSDVTRDPRRPETAVR